MTNYLSYLSCIKTDAIAKSYVALSVKHALGKRQVTDEQFNNLCKRVDDHLGHYDAYEIARAILYNADDPFSSAPLTRREWENCWENMGD